MRPDPKATRPLVVRKVTLIPRIDAGQPARIHGEKEPEEGDQRERERDGFLHGPIQVEGVQILILCTIKSPSFNILISKHVGLLTETHITKT